jgi:hypothetical protein
MQAQGSSIAPSDVPAAIAAAVSSYVGAKDMAEVVNLGREFKPAAQILPGQAVDGKCIVERIGSKLARELMLAVHQEGLAGLGDRDFVRLLLAASAAPLAYILKQHVMGIDKASLNQALKLGRVTIETMLTRFEGIEQYGQLR